MGRVVGQDRRGQGPEAGPVRGGAVVPALDGPVPRRGSVAVPHHGARLRFPLVRVAETSADGGARRNRRRRRHGAAGGDGGRGRGVAVAFCATQASDGHSARGPVGVRVRGLVVGQKMQAGHSFDGPRRGELRQLLQGASDQVLFCLPLPEQVLHGLCEDSGGEDATKSNAF